MLEGVTRSQAEDFIEQARTEARKGRLNLPKGRKVALGFREAAEKYLIKLEKEGGKDLKKKEQRLRLHLSPFFKDKPLSSIAAFDLERFKKSRKEEGVTNGTINRELAALSHLFSKAVEWKWIDHRPAKINRLKEDGGRMVYLTTAQAAELLNKAAEHQSAFIYPFIRIALETSMRRSEILSIRLEHIDLQRRIIFIPQAKAGAREQPITKKWMFWKNGISLRHKTGRFAAVVPRHDYTGITQTEKIKRKRVAAFWTQPFEFTGAGTGDTAIKAIA